MAAKTQSLKAIKEHQVNISAHIWWERVMGGYLNKLPASYKIGCAVDN